MATNNNKIVDMKQLWQQMEPAPVASSALSAMATSEDGLDRYIYYLVGATFFRYDTYGNTWHKLAAPLVTPTVFAKMKYGISSGSVGRVISATSTTVRIGGLNKGVYDGDNIRIIAGTGAGQIRTITGSTEPVIYDQGLATTASTTQIGDSTKKWKFNQWAGYQVRLIYSTGQSQVRKILYNDTTTLTVSDANHQPHDSFNNAPFVVAPITTAGSQTHFIIEASDLTIGTSSWAVTPDYTSRFRIDSGGIWLLTSAASGAYMSIQYYDVRGDFWVNKTVPTGIVLAAFGTDGALERTGEIGGIYLSGTTTSGGTYTLTDTTKSMTPGAYNNFRVRITGGTGVGQSRRIIANGTNYFEVARKWDVALSTDSTYEIVADRDKLYIMGHAQSMLLQYDIDADLVIQAPKYDDGLACAMGGAYAGLETLPIAFTSGTRGTTGITAVASAPTVGGTNYVVGDILTCSATGTNGKVIVESVGPGGIITAVSLLRPGSGYSTGAGKSTTGGSGSGATIEITSVGTVCNIVTTINHMFQIGQSINIYGDTAYSGTTTIIGCDSLTGIDIATGAAGNMTAPNAQSATLIVDVTKNWTINEHVGKIVQTHLVGTAGAVQPRVITSNTQTTITVATITTALVNGTGRYIITDLAGFGRDNQYRVAYRDNNGWATSGTTTTLYDSTKSWYTNQWANARIRIKAGTGRDSYFFLSGNTANTLVYTGQSFTPDATTVYSIQATYGTGSAAGTTSTIVDSSKNWAVNQWAGKKVRLTAGPTNTFGLAATANEILITSNTSNTLTFAAITSFAPDATTAYTILGPPPRSTGTDLIWVFGGSLSGKYLYSPRGGAQAFWDRYNILTEEWEYPIFMTPQTDTFTTGSAYSYDGGNIIYISPGVATGIVQYVYAFDVRTNKVKGFGAIPNTQLAPVLGNRMEIIESPQGIQYLYHMRNTGADLYRAMIWF